MYLYIKSLNIFPTFYIYVIIFYVTILIVNSPLKIFQIFQKIFKICILETGKKFWKKKKNYCDQKSNDVWKFHVLTHMSKLPILLYFNISITVSQQIGDKIAFIQDYIFYRDALRDGFSSFI